MGNQASDTSNKKNKESPIPTGSGISSPKDNEPKRSRSMVDITSKIKSLRKNNNKNDKYNNPSNNPTATHNTKQERSKTTINIEEADLPPCGVYLPPQELTHANLESKNRAIENKNHLNPYNHSHNHSNHNSHSHNTHNHNHNNSNHGISKMVVTTTSYHTRDESKTNDEFYSLLPPPGDEDLIAVPSKLAWLDQRRARNDIWDHFEPVRELGTGISGTVREVIAMTDGKTYAMK